MKLSELAQTPQGVTVGAPGPQGGTVVSVAPAPTTQTIQTGGGSTILATTAPSVLAPSTSGAKLFIPATVFVAAGKVGTGTPTQTVTSGPAVTYQSVSTIQPQQAPQPSPASVSSGGQVATTVSAPTPALAPVAVRGATPAAPVKPLTAQGETLKQPAQVAVSKPATASPVTTPAQPSTATPWLKYVLVAFGVLAVGYALTKKK